MATAPLLPNDVNDVNNRPEGSRVPRRGRNRTAIWGTILLIAGFSTLASSLNWFEGVAGIIFAVLFAAVGLAFGYLFLRDNPRNWWAAIPAFALMGLSGTIMVSEYAPVRIAFLGGAVFLGALSLGFLAVYAVRRDFWWALIPGGALLSLAVTAALGDSGFGVGRDNLVGGVFIFGLGITFLAVALAPPTHDRNRWWAYIPAALLMVLGALIFMSATTYLESFNVLMAIAMVIGGGYLLLKALGNRNVA